MVVIGWVMIIGIQTHIHVSGIPLEGGWFWWKMAAYILIGGCFFIGFMLIRRARRESSLSVAKLLATDPRPPILYLRSFNKDVIESYNKTMQNWYVGLLIPTQEERLARVMNSIGPFIAIGRPAEKLPKIGASRLYLSDNKWQEVVTDLLRCSKLVVLRVGNTPGFWWEVEHVMREVDLNRVLFFFDQPSKRIYTEFRDRARTFFPCDLPDEIGSAQFLFLEQVGEEWTPRTIRLQFAIGRHSVERSFFKSLQPILERFD